MAMKINTLIRARIHKHKEKADSQQEGNVHITIWEKIKTLMTMLPEDYPQKQLLDDIKGEAYLQQFLVNKRPRGGKNIPKKRCSMPSDRGLHHNQLQKAVTNNKNNSRATMSASEDRRRCSTGTGRSHESQYREDPVHPQLEQSTNMEQNMTVKIIQIPPALFPIFRNFSKSTPVKPGDFPLTSTLEIRGRQGSTP